MNKEMISLLKHRGSVRKFKDEPISEDILQDILECGVRSASAGNLQPFSIIRMSKEADKEFLVKDCEMQAFVERAPENLLFCIDFHRLKKWAEINKAPFAANHSYNHFWVIFQDVVIAAQSIATSADAYGLGSCYIGTTTDCARKLVEHCELPYGVFPVVLLTLGYPDQEIVSNTKLKVEDVLHESKYHDYRDETIKKMYDEKYKGYRFPLNDRNKKTIYEVAKNVNGEDYAKQCVEEMERAQMINYAQYRFGLHYKADEMLEGRDELVALLQEQGIDWIK